HVQNSVEYENFNRERGSHVQNSVEYENFNRDRSPLAQKSDISEYFHQEIVSCYLNIIKIFSFRKSGVSLQLFCGFLNKSIGGSIDGTSRNLSSETRSTFCDGIKFI